MSKNGIAMQTLKQFAPEHYLACLFISEPFRNDVAVLWAFDAEIRRVPQLVSEPMPGEIRLQWWRDLVKSGDNSGSGPLANALMEVMANRELPKEIFDNYIEARIFDLYQDPMPDTGTLEGYLGETVSCFFLMSALACGAERSTLLADACGHAGMALGLSQILSRCALDRKQERLYFPLDMLAKHDLDRELWLSPDFTVDHSKVIQELCSLTQYHLTFARSLFKQLPKELRSLFLSVSLVEPLLKRVNKSPLDILNHPVLLSPLRRQWEITKAALREIP